MQKVAHSCKHHGNAMFIGGIVLGAVIGAVAMVLIELWQAILSKAKERKAD